MNSLWNIYNNLNNLGTFHTMLLMSTVFDPDQRIQHQRINSLQHRLTPCTSTTEEAEEADSTLHNHWKNTKWETSAAPGVSTFLECWVYVGYPVRLEPHRKPTARYMSMVLAGAECLPEDYVEMLKKVETLH